MTALSSPYSPALLDSGWAQRRLSLADRGLHHATVSLAGTTAGVRGHGPRARFAFAPAAPPNPHSPPPSPAAHRDDPACLPPSRYLYLSSSPAPAALMLRRQRQIVRHMQIFQHLLRNAFEYRSRNLRRPGVGPTAESRITVTTICGLFTGANPANEATYFVFEYAPVAGSTFCPVPVFPADEYPSRVASRPVPSSTTFSIIERISAAVYEEITRCPSAG